MRTSFLDKVRPFVTSDVGRILMSIVVVLVALAAGLLVFLVGEIINGSAVAASAIAGEANTAGVEAIGKTVVVARIGDIEITPTALNAVAAIAVTIGIIAHALLLMGSPDASGRVLNAVGLGIWVSVTLFLGGVYIYLTNEARGQPLTAELVSQLANKIDPTTGLPIDDPLAGLVTGGRVVISAIIPIALVSMGLLTAVGSVWDSGGESASSVFARLAWFCIFTLVVLASGLHLLQFGIGIGYAPFAAVAGTVIAELTFVLAKTERYRLVLWVSAIYLFYINAAAGFLASNNLEALQADPLYAWSPEIYSAMPIVLALLLALTEASRSGESEGDESWLLRKARSGRAAYDTLRRPSHNTSSLPPTPHAAPITMNSEPVEQPVPVVVPLAAPQAVRQPETSPNGAGGGAAAQSKS